MKKFGIALMLLIIQSCATNKGDKSLDSSIYRLIINDIKKTTRFVDFKKSKNKNCSNISVVKYEYHLCEFADFFKDKEIKKAYLERCKNIDLSDLKTDRNDLNKFSDKGDRCFIAHFSQIIKDKIIIEITPSNKKRRINNESLYFLYKILGKNQIKKLESSLIIHE